MLWGIIPYEDEAQERFEAFLSVHAVDPLRNCSRHPSIYKPGFYFRSGVDAQSPVFCTLPAVFLGIDLQRTINFYPVASAQHRGWRDQLAIYTEPVFQEIDLGKLWEDAGQFYGLFRGGALRQIHLPYNLFLRQCIHHFDVNIRTRNFHRLSDVNTRSGTPINFFCALDECFHEAVGNDEENG